MTPARFRRERRALGLSIKRASELFECTARTLRRWEAGTQDFPDYAVYRMTALAAGRVTISDIEAAIEDQEDD